MWAVGLVDPAGTVLGTSGLGCCDAHVPAFHTSMWHPHTQCIRSMVLPQEPSFCDPGGQGAGVVSRYLASKFGCNTEGITLSPVQAQRAAEICGPRGLSDRCKYQVRKQMQLCILPEVLAQLFTVQSPAALVVLVLRAKSTLGSPAAAFSCMHRSATLLLAAYTYIHAGGRRLAAAVCWQLIRPRLVA